MMNAKRAAIHTCLGVFLFASALHAQAATEAVSRLQHFAEGQLREFTEMRQDFANTMGDRLASDASARRELRDLDRAIQTLGASLRADEEHPTNFSEAELKSDLFSAQDAARTLLDLGISAGDRAAVAPETSTR